MDKHRQDTVKLVWDIAELLRGDYRPREYVDVILPLVVLRRLDQAIEEQREAVWETYERLQKRGLTNLDGQLRLAASSASSAGGELTSAANGKVVYNVSRYDWQRLLEDQNNLAQNLITYLNGFSPEVRDIIEKFDFRRQVQRLQSTNPPLLYPVMKAFEPIDLHPERVLNHQMGDIFEELIRRFSEQYNETAGEYFTPREVIRLMVRLMFSEDDSELHKPGLIRTIYDPACGTGGMLTEAKHYLDDHYPIEVYLFGQEINPTAYAVAKSDMLLKGENPERIYFGNTFSDDGHIAEKFHYMLSNPPFGVDWKKVEWVIKREYQTRGYDGRFGAGLPRINDGSLLFLQHLISKMQRDEESRIAIVLNGSPLFTGDAGSGESEIRRWIIENDWLEGIVALPGQLFYNTGINTYLWLLTNRKSARRRGKIQLVNAVGEAFYRKMKKSKGDKRNEIAPAQIDRIVEIYKDFDEQKEENETYCKIFPNTFFGYRKVRIDRPLRLNFQASPARKARIAEERAFQQLAESKLKDERAKQQEEELGRRYQEQIVALLDRLPDDLFLDRAAFEDALRHAASKANVVLTSPIQKAILSALSERDERATICRDKKGNPEPDLDLRDYESVPLRDGEERIEWHTQFDEKIPLLESVAEYLNREVFPFLNEAIIDTSYTDDKDQRIGKIGYEIHFTRYFYIYEAPRPLAQIQVEIQQLERAILKKLREISGSST